MITNERKNVLVLIGPTASGKTEAAISLAKRINGEIICADSRQIYKEMDIGTAKPTPEQKKQAPHHLFDIVSPDEPFTVFDYKERAEKTIKEILSRNRAPVLVGGSGLYIKALVDNLSLTSVPPNPSFRQRIKQDMEEKGLDFFYQKLSRIDPAYAGKISKNDERRVVRALEVFEATGIPFSDFHSQTPSVFSFQLFGLCLQKEQLYQRIDERVEQMMLSGLPDEVRTLAGKGYSTKLKAFQSPGYAELIPVLTGEKTLEDAAAEIKKNTRHLAKRQMTWFKKDKRIRWLDVNNKSAGQITEEIYATK